MRWWDGVEWTEHAVPAQGPTAAGNPLAVAGFVVAIVAVIVMTMLAGIRGPLLALGMIGGWVAWGLSIPGIIASGRRPRRDGFALALLGIIIGGVAVIGTGVIFLALGP